MEDGDARSCWGGNVRWDVDPTKSGIMATMILQFCLFIMRRASEASVFFLGFPRKKKPLHNGSYEHRVPKIYTYIFSTRCQGCLCVWVFVCVCDST